MKKTSKSQTHFREWVRDRIVFLAFVIFILGASGYIGAGKIFDPDGIWVHPVKEFALLLSLVGVVSLGYELFLRELTFREYKDALEELVNPHAVRLGIQGIFKNRSELGQSVSFEGLFKNVKREIFIGGTSLLSISSSSRELLKEKVLNGIQVKLLLMDPDSSVVELITKQGGGKPTFLNEIKTSLLLLQKLQHELPKKKHHFHSQPRKGKSCPYTPSPILGKIPLSIRRSPKTQLYCLPPCCAHQRTYPRLGQLLKALRCTSKTW